MLATLRAVLFAELSYRLIERPALRLEERFVVVRGSTPDVPEGSARGRPRSGVRAAPPQAPEAAA